MKKIEAEVFKLKYFFGKVMTKLIARNSSKIFTCTVDLREAPNMSKLFSPDSRIFLASLYPKVKARKISAKFDNPDVCLSIISEDI